MTIVTFIFKSVFYDSIFSREVESTLTKNNNLGLFLPKKKAIFVCFLCCIKDTMFTYIQLLRP